MNFKNPTQRQGILKSTKNTTGKVSLSDLENGLFRNIDDLCMPYFNSTINFNML